MIDATRIETPEVERPDLYVYVHEVGLRQRRDWAINGPFPDSSKPDHGAVGMRLPGTRREKLTKEREKLIADVVSAVRDWDANHNVSGMAVINPARRLADFDAALLDLDAEGVKG